jgi:CubicO group peptidase (beta-lactamase class C family)
MSKRVAIALSAVLCIGIAVAVVLSAGGGSAPTAPSASVIAEPVTAEAVIAEPVIAEPVIAVLSTQESTTTPRAEVGALSREAAWRAAGEYSREAHGEFLLVMQDGKVIYEDGIGGWNRTRPHPLASGTKSFTGVAAMLAVQQGLFALDDKVSDTITEWKSDPRKREITVRQLLNLSSGIEADSEDNRKRNRTLATGNSVQRLRAAAGQRDDFHAQAVRAPMLHEAGARFEYGANHFYAFTEFLERTLRARDVAPSTAWEWYEKNLFDPIGMKVARIGRDRQGHANVAGGASLTAEEWAKFGEFVRLGGRVRSADGSDVQVLRSDLLQQCFEPSQRNARYGLTWWLAPRRAPTDLPGVFMAAGLGKQRLYVVPSARLVVVRFAPINSERSGFSDSRLLALILEAVGEEPIPSDDISVRSPTD